MRRRMRNVALAAVASASVLAAIAGCGSSGSSSATTGVTLKLYNDKGAWSPFFNQLGTTSKKDIGISMSPVGYTDEPTYQAFIQASFHTNKKPDLFTWQTGGQLADEPHPGERAAAGEQDPHDGLRPAPGFAARCQAGSKSRQERSFSDNHAEARSWPGY